MGTVSEIDGLGRTNESGLWVTPDVAPAPTKESFPSVAVIGAAPVLQMDGVITGAKLETL